MTDLDVKDTVCIVIIFSPLKCWIFGVYESIDLAKKRVREQEYMIPYDSFIRYHESPVWKEKAVSE